MEFTFLFYRHIIFRKSFGNCYLCKTRRPSDITIGVLGMGKNNPNINKDDKGVSLLLVNTEQIVICWNWLNTL